MKKLFLQLFTVLLIIPCFNTTHAADRLLVIGDATWGGWSLDRSSVMVRDSINPDLWRYTGYLTADREYKFLTECGWDKLEYRNASTDPYLLGRGALIACTTNANDNKFKVRESANYTLSCNLADMSIVVQKADYQGKPVYHDVLYMVGDATPGGWFLPASTPLYAHTANPLVYSATVKLQPGIFKLATNCHGGYTEQKFYHRDANNPEGVSEVTDGDLQWQVSSDGLYNVCVNLDDMSIRLTPAEQRSLLGEVLDWKRNGKAVDFICRNGILSITPYAPSVFKVFTLPSGSNAEERRSISVCSQPDCSFSVSENADAIVIGTSESRVSVRRSDARVEFADANGNVRLLERGGLNNSALPRRIDFDGMDDAAFYGGGYNGKYVNLDGKTLIMNNTQTGGWDNSWDAPHNICVPFIVSASGYGLLVDDHYRDARLTPSKLGTSYTSGSHNPISYYYIGAPNGTMAAVMENYTWLTGRQPLPPHWALGYMTSRYGYHSSAEAKQVIDNIKQADLPLDGIVFDLYWQGEGNSGMGNLNWYKTNFPDPKAMMADFASKGVKTVCITEPFFTSVSANYETLRSKGYLADEDVSGMEWLGAPKTGLIDASNPNAMDWMWQFYRTLSDQGVAGWWLDLGEPERHDSDSRHTGGSVNQVHNEFADLWTARVFRGYRDEYPDVRPFLMPRAGTAGMQRYSTFPWSGDIRRSYRGLAAQIPALLSASMSGIGYLGNDVGGFTGETPDPRLYLRWIQMATFSPMLRTHGTNNPEPYLDCYASVLPDIRRFINLRYSYLPYTYTLAWQNSTIGLPLARPLNFHDSPAAKSPVGCTDQYLWGRDIMVAPVVDNATQRSISFPEGRWLDLNDMTRVYSGGTSVNYAAPLDCLPHFARMGTFIPRYSADTYSNTADIDHSQLTVLYTAELDAPSSKLNSAQLFDDDRTGTRTIERGQYAVTTFSGRNTSGGHEISIDVDGNYEGMPAERRYTLVIPNYRREVYGVSVSGGKCESYQLDSQKCLQIKVVAQTSEKITVNVSDGGASVDEISPRDTSIRYSAAANSFEISGLTHNSVLRFTDMQGRCVAELNVDSNASEVSCPDLRPGVYLVTLAGCKPLKISK